MPIEIRLIRISGGLFAVAQLSMFWGRLSDRVGRKPVMLTGLFGMAISVIAFGLQKTYLGLIISRFIAGMMNGGLIFIVAEFTDPTNYADAVALLPLSFAIGSIIGPIVGGFLALPAQNLPFLFGNCDFLIEYPYFLLCLIGGMLNFLAIILGIFCLEETLETKRKPRHGTQRPTPSQEVVNGGLGMSLDQIEVVNGGLGMSLDQIGFILSVNGVGLIFVQLFRFPPLQRRFGAVNLYKCYLVHIKGNTATMSLA
ncbi:uncharacterized protein MELLADRAFT_86514 [Melampsora larici-populina 98AG31]|uniref:Major facilitator superfamily (MFS) profile domain-containing protein n=1 Tax=Melampsora larici-populina (strain 98AG31 / pathotype 3-4-7) TaxID=747676 RepID=F4SDP2_MELLP|nr:uncharacterized protein MELLADRAFT_86514 [Melampsora larici-populina 98AG31]EGF97233.1 hypothetical protein MELLADRAFT_86514 [Melampsora larici-populina 98AG31]